MHYRTLVDDDDKRTITSGPEFLVERVSERVWHYCKYCSKKTPTFRFIETRYGAKCPLQELRCCWECGSGIKLLYPSLETVTKFMEMEHPSLG